MSEVKYNGGPAFPTPMQSGMTLRDYFAAKALAAIIHVNLDRCYFNDHERLARESYEYADAMLAERAE